MIWIDLTNSCTHIHTNDTTQQKLGNNHESWQLILVSALQSNSRTLTSGKQGRSVLPLQVCKSVCVYVGGSELKPNHTDLWNYPSSVFLLPFMGYIRND